MTARTASKPTLSREPLTMTQAQRDSIEKRMPAYLAAHERAGVATLGLTTDWEDCSQWEAQQLIIGISETTKELSLRAKLARIREPAPTTVETARSFWASSSWQRLSS